MISIRWWKFEWELRRLVRQRLRGSKALWREYRRRSNLRRRIANWSAAPLGIVVYWAFAVAPLMRLHEGLGDAAFGVGLNLTGLMWTGIALVRSENLAVGLRSGWYLMTLLRFPVSDRTIFRHLLIRFLMRSAALATFYFGGSMYLLAWQRGGLDWSVTAWAVLAALLQTLASLGLSVALMDRFPRARLGITGLLLCGMGFGFAIGCDWFARFLLGMSDWLLWMTPAGWVMLMVHNSQWLLLLPFALLVAAGFWRVQQLQATYRAPELESLLPAVSVAEDFEAISPAELAKLTETVATKQFLRGVDWEKCRWMERLVGWWLTARERLLTEFLLGGHAPQWSKNWKGALKLAAIGAVLSLVPGTIAVWVAVGAFGIATLAATASFPLEWPGLRGVPTFGPAIPIYALVPCGFWEIARTVAKANIIRALTWLPAMVVCSAVAAWRLGLDPMRGAGFGARVSGVELLGQPIAVVLLFSARTNDSRTIFQRLAWVQALVLVAALLSVAAGAVTLFAPMKMALPAAVVFGVSGTVCLGLYALWYHRGAFDLMRIAPTGRGP